MSEERNAQERAQAKIAIAMKSFKSSKRRIEDLEWWIQILTAMSSDPEPFGKQIKILTEQIEEWKHQG